MCLRLLRQIVSLCVPRAYVSSLFKASLFVAFFVSRGWICLQRATLDGMDMYTADGVRRWESEDEALTMLELLLKRQLARTAR